MDRPAHRGEPPSDRRRLVADVAAIGWSILVQVVGAIVHLIGSAVRRIERSPGPPNVCRLSWWSIAAVVLNVPWVWALLWAIWVVTTSKREIAGEIFLVPACVWVGSGGPAAACGLIGIIQVFRHEGRLRGLWLSAIGIGIAAVGPGLAILDDIYESFHDSP